MPETLATELFALERRYWQAIQDRDVDAALELTADPCVVAGASGVATIDRESFRKIMGAATYTLHSFSFGEDTQAREVTDGVALLAYTVTEQLTVDGKPLTLKAADTSVWTRTAGGWRCAMHTESVLGDAYGRDRT